MPLHLVQRPKRQLSVIGNESNSRVNVMFRLCQKVSSDHVRIARGIRNYEYLARPRQLIDTNRAENLTFGLIHIGIARPDNLVNGRDALGAKCHGRDGLSATYAKNAVRPRQMAAGDHGWVSIGGQAGNDLVTACHLGWDQSHHGRRENGVSATWNIGADSLNGNNPMAQVHTRQFFDVQWQQSAQLCLGKSLYPRDSELRIRAGLWIQIVQGTQPFRLNLECLARISVQVP